MLFWQSKSDFITKAYYLTVEQGQYFGTGTTSIRLSKKSWLESVPILLVLLSFAAAYAPMFVRLAQGPWQTEQEGHGPLILAAAAWIAWQSRRKIYEATKIPAPVAGWAVLMIGLAIMVVSRSQDILFIEVLSQIPVMAGCVLILAGWQVLRIIAFPIAFVFFSAPPPGWLLDAFTVPLKAFVSDIVTQLLYASGYPVAQNGVMIMIGSYQLLVKDACAGMNSIFALSAIGIFYIYIMGYRSTVRNVILLASILPITVAANFVRVLALVFIAYYDGIDAIEGAYHELTGLALFVVAMLLLWALDMVISLGSRLVAPLTKA